MNMKKRNFILIIVLTFIVGAGLSFGGFKLFASGGIGNVKISQDEYNKLKYMESKYSKLEDMYTSIEKQYYKGADDNELMAGIYKGLLEGLDDPYSAYMTKDEYESWRASTLGEFEGVGITFIEDDDGSMVVVSTVEESPAQKAGIRADDILLKVDNKEYENSEAMAAALRGESGTKVDLLYSRDGSEKSVTLTRTAIVIESVYSEMMEDDIGYIQIAAFEENTAEDFEAELRDLEVKGMKGLIVDLRNNGGGIVEEGTEIADMLIGKGDIVHLQDKEGKKETYRSDEDKIDVPYVILVNEGTASTSEILAAAIKDNKAGKIVGMKTYGKGVVQGTSELDDGDAIRLTIMQYLSPNGRKIHEKGVNPDYKVQIPKDGSSDTQLNKALELLK